MRKNTCSCGKPIEDSRKGQRYCKDCHAKYMRENRKRHSELNPEAKKKVICRSYANVYLRRRKIKKQPCVICGDENSQMHHKDYNKPLDITWLCRDDHLSLHKNIGPIAPGLNKKVDFSTFKYYFK